MPHNFQKVDWVVMETLRLYKHKMEIFSMMSHDYEDDFKKDFAVGDTIRVKYPWQPEVKSGFSYQGQTIDRIITEVKIDQPMHVGVDWDTIDRVLNMERGEEQVKKEYIEPMATYLAAEADKRAALFAAQNTGNITGVLGVDPTTLDTVSAAPRQRFMELNALHRTKGIYVPPAVMRKVKGGNVSQSGAIVASLFHPASEIKKLYMEGIVGQADGFDWHESNSLYLHTAGTWAGAVTLASAVANGGSSLSVACTLGDTFNKGDVIGIASVFRVNPITRTVTEVTNTMSVTVAETVVASGATATIPIIEKLFFQGNYQNISAQPAASAVLTLFPGTALPNGKQGKQGLAFTRDAFAGVTLPLPVPTGGVEVASTKTDPETKLSLAFVRAFDVFERRWINRMDSLIGFGRLWADRAAMRILSA